jgi:hypothetical protein
MKTMYEKLQAHLTKHAYTRGRNKGDAPLDASRRGRSHERVTRCGDCMAVRFHRTNVILAYPDGRITINCDGWGMAPTTRSCINDALRWFGGNNAWMYSDRMYGKTQLVLKTTRGMHAYYDGITIDADGTLLSEPKPFKGKRIDKAATKELYADMQECGFKDVFRLLHAVAEKLPHANDPLYETVRFARPSELRDFITQEVHSNKWPYVVDLVSFRSGFDWKTQRTLHIKYDYKTAWSNLMSAVKEDLYNTVAIEEDNQASNP